MACDLEPGTESSSCRDGFLQGITASCLTAGSSLLAGSCLGKKYTADVSRRDEYPLPRAQKSTGSCTEAVATAGDIMHADSEQYMRCAVRSLERQTLISSLTAVTDAVSHLARTVARSRHGLRSIRPLRSGGTSSCDASWHVSGFVEPKEPSVAQ